jgi:hypothetical protein
MNQQLSLLYPASEWIAMIVNPVREKQHNQIRNSLDSKSSLFEGKNLVMSNASCTKISTSMKLLFPHLLKTKTSVKKFRSLYYIKCFSLCGWPNL